MVVSERRLDWAVMQAKSELARQARACFVSLPDDLGDPEDGSKYLVYDGFDLRALVGVVLEAGDSGVNDAVSSVRVEDGVLVLSRAVPIKLPLEVRFDG